MTSLTPSQSEQPLQSRLLRKQEFQNIQIIEFAGFQDGCQHQVLLQRAFSETTAGVTAILGKALAGMLGIVVVPRRAVMVKEREHLFAAFLKSLLVLACQRRDETGRSH